MVHEFVPHARRRDEKVEAILDAAMRLLASEGLEALTLQRVARELGLVTTALYRYFPSKDVLLAAMQRRAVAALHARFVRAKATWSKAAARLEPKSAALLPIVGAARFYVALPETMPEPFRLVAILLGDTRVLVSDDEAAKAVPVVSAFVADAAAPFEEAAQVGALEGGQAIDRTLIFWAAVHGLTQLSKLRRVAPGAPSRDALADQAAHALLIGFGASPDSLRRATKALDRARERNSTQDSKGDAR
ncbi:MAG: helix-turn-helix domain-containing protein [Polyangiales bacterium]